jgi:methylglyoxal synthase
MGKSIAVGVAVAAVTAAVLYFIPLWVAAPNAPHDPDFFVSLRFYVAWMAPILGVAATALHRGM